MKFIHVWHFSQGNGHLRRANLHEKERREQREQTRNSQPDQNEIEELYLLRTKVAKQQDQILNLQKTVGEILLFFANG